RLARARAAGWSGMGHLYSLQGAMGGFLLSRATAGATPADQYSQLRDRALHLEFLVMGRAMRGRHRVLGKRDASALQIFLQQGLGILAKRLGVDVRHPRLVLASYDAAGLLE